MPKTNAKSQPPRPKRPLGFQTPSQTWPSACNAAGHFFVPRAKVCIQQEEDIKKKALAFIEQEGRRIELYLVKELDVLLG